ncbi:helix-turn-helix domain-containing protein [Sporosarcina sp. JAI121]|uniref:helix-turn-helix domain-containing protein n=1 Tax=Sporosarcina sp. JAI121 TaxID=2723064 RepID=UPI0015C89FB3|nr:cupin domain-containing protein [Sporosarcina sp. JAI121]NYF24374.1 transcriptional regulator with XRE-family HTH domain [Sporosarcina sp. JAI121]
MDEINISIGEQIRSIRQAKGITINYISKKTGFTSSFISQLERGLTKGSISSIQKIANELDIKISSLFYNIEEEDHKAPSISITRKDNRRTINYPDEKTIDYLLSERKGNLEVFYTEIKQGGESGEYYSHDSEKECIIVLKGQMEISVDESKYVLNAGDTINFCSQSPHAWKNAGEDTLEVIWIITHPNY